MLTTIAIMAFVLIITFSLFLMKEAAILTPTIIIVLVVIAIGIFGLIIYFIVSSLKKRAHKNQSLMLDMSKKYNFDLKMKEKISTKEKEIELFNEELFYGQSIDVYNYMKGYYQNHFIEIYYYKYYTGHDSNLLKYAKEYIIFEMPIKKKLSKLVMFSNNDFLMKNPSFIDSMANYHDIKTESNEFNKLFAIKINDDKIMTNKINILEILSPDIMDELLDELNRDKERHIYIEMNKNKVIISKHIDLTLTFKNKSPIDNEEDFKKMLDLSVNIANKI